MLTTISRVMTAVVACASSVGGSPINATRSTPPFLADGAWAWLDEAVSQVAVVSTASTVRARGTRCMERLLWGSYDTADHPRPKAIECRG